MAVAQSKSVVSSRSYKKVRRANFKNYKVCDHIALGKLVGGKRHEEKDVFFSRAAQVCPLCFKIKV